MRISGTEPSSVVLSQRSITEHVQGFNICYIVGVQIVFYTWTHVLEHMQTFST